VHSPLGLVYAWRMKISLDWLGDYLDWKEIDPAKIAERLTMGTGEVEEIISPGSDLQGCCVGKILSLTKHPNADRLSLCTVQTDKGKKKIVCGGTNLREGMRVAFAHVGTEVQHDGERMVLEKIKIRGEESEGMICAAEELNLLDRFPPDEEEGKFAVIDLGDGDDSVGTPLAKFLGLTDTVIDIDNHAITHRADLFSHIGFARECMALGLAVWKKEPVFTPPVFPQTKAPFTFHVDAPDLMPRYCACMLSIDSLGETPDWMKRRLEATGWRSLNLPIDITNYVMMEVGVPLHSFDADDFKGDVRMRTAKEGEKIVTLDEKERVLPVGALVLSDDEGIFDLLGIMGGLRSSTKETTKSIYLHSAVLDPVSIRRTIIATGHRTEAATVYEKGIPHIIAEQGFYRALELFLTHVPGAKVVSKLEEWGDNGVGPSIHFPLPRIEQVLGKPIKESTTKQILMNLGFDVQKKGEGALTVTPPLWRLGDIIGPHDLIEEVGRIYGYDALEPQLPVASIMPPPRDHRLNALRCAFKEESFFEIYPLSLVGPQLLAKCRIDPATAPVVENALGEEFSLMQPSVLPGILEHARDNLRSASDCLRTFHCSNVFSGGEKSHRELGALVASKDGTSLSSDPFLLLKASLLSAAAQVGLSITLQPLKKPPAYAHPGRAAQLMIGKEVVGELFEVHPAVRSAFDLPQRSAAVCIDVDALLALPGEPPLAQSVSQFPSVAYDITLSCTPQSSVGDIRQQAQEQSGLLESIEVVDLYDPRAEDRTYKVTFRCTYRAPDRTLTEEEVKREHEKVCDVVA